MTQSWNFGSWLKVKYFKETLQLLLFRILSTYFGIIHSIFKCILKRYCIYSAYNHLQIRFSLRTMNKESFSWNNWTLMPNFQFLLRHWPLRRKRRLSNFPLRLLYPSFYCEISIFRRTNRPLERRKWLIASVERRITAWENINSVGLQVKVIEVLKIAQYSALNLFWYVQYKFLAFGVHGDYLVLNLE